MFGKSVYQIGRAINANEKSKKRAAKKAAASPYDLKIKRVEPGHLLLVGEYITDDQEVFAELLALSSRKWVYRLWTWGSQNPAPVGGFSDQTFESLAAAQSFVVDCINQDQPRARGLK